VDNLWTLFVVKRARIADLPSGIGITRNSNGITDYWRVRLGKKFTGGNIITRNFEALADARRWIFGNAQKLKTVTMPAIELRRMAGSAAFELSSAEIAQATAAIRKCRSAGITLHAAVDYAIKRMNLAERSKTLQEVADFVIAYKHSNGASPRHLKGMRSIFSKVCEDLGERPLNEITREAIEEWQAEQDDVILNTRISYARHFHILFSEAAERGWCVENPVAKLKRNSEATGDPEIWSPAQLARFLAAAMEHEPALVVGLVIKAFAGVRTAELLTLRWERISSNKIQIVGKSAKTRRSRGIPIQPVLSAWLKGRRHAEGPVIELSENGWFGAVQRVAVAAGIEQPSNVLRHSFGTYRYHATKSEDETSYEMGNTPAVILAWYRSVAVEDRHVRQWWRLTPPLVERWSRLNKL
jgi:integrase